VDKRIIGNELSKFLKDSLKICKENSDQINFDEEKWPLFYPDGKYKKYEIKKIPDYDYFVRFTIKNEIQKLISYKIITKYLVTSNIKQYNKKIQDSNSKQESDFIKIFPLKFIITYLEQTKDVLFEKKKFEITKEKFFEFLDSPLEDEYIVPLFNFDSDLKQEKNFGGLIIRKISDFEFKNITKLDEYPNLPVIYKELTDIMVLRVLKEDLISGYDVAKEKFQILLEAFLLFSDGNPQFGTIHRNMNNPWIHISNNYEKEVLKQKILFFRNKDHKKILNIFNDLEKIDFSLKENHFLLIAIRRFSSALSRNDSIDQFLDLMICLEALFAPKDKGEITTKLSTRLATLVAKNENDRKDYWLFMRKMYNLRSGIVHGEGIRNTEINGKKYEMDDIRQKIIKLVRESILCYLKLVRKYSGSKKVEKICNDIDLALLDKKNLQELRLKLK
jgi:hypothetical protein